ncbi:MAG TPA: hypothetical protein VFY93_08670 [Planctomycetota bacterium]|nr:hypothetical protein [Planctomycetota bacterium]
MSKSLLIGIVVGIAAGAGATLYWKSLESPAIKEAPNLPPLPSVNPHGGSPPGVTSPHGAANPHGGATPPAQAGPHGSEGIEKSIATIHFMREFVAALTDRPDNLLPNPGYEPLLKTGAAMIRCADCHTDPSLNMEGMIASDPGDEAVEPFRMRRRGFMIPLMEKWVARLNKMHADRLRGEVTCLDCHAQDPRDDAMMPPLMIRFVKALTAKPQNKNPAQGWKPLLKESAAVSCGTCHGQTGAAMEKNLASLDGPAPEAAENHGFMVKLMERWVRELNKRAKDQLTKAVVCTDCHDVDPRK